MRIVIESLRRLYISNKVTEDKIIDMFLKGIITENEKTYILRKEEKDVHNIN